MGKNACLKRSAVYCAFIVLASLLVFVNVALSDDDSCIHCGMMKAKFGHSWVIIEHSDGTQEGVCSVHCAAIDMALHTHLPVENITVGDYNTKKQIDVDKAYWVIGGDKMGVMTTRAKWAFETKKAADAFIAEHGGRPSTFEEVMKAAFEDMYEDSLMIQKKRQMMKMKKNQS
ncbi:nitrous oxide reductase accessory protein NosL [Desulfosarcina sp.]|uniref:nitrous oxide reductase accessory protein NosL n=1 Tax=Desulfosarcina sp. TaxID=2027861 RepID=UPI0035660652